MEKILSNGEHAVTKEKFLAEEHEKIIRFRWIRAWSIFLRTFRDFLLIERRRAVNTVESYGRDVESFFYWLQENGDVSPANCRRASSSIISRISGRRGNRTPRCGGTWRPFARSPDCWFATGTQGRILRRTLRNLQNGSVCPRLFRKKRCQRFCWRLTAKHRRRCGTRRCSSFCTPPACA